MTSRPARSVPCSMLRAFAGPLCAIGLLMSPSTLQGQCPPTATEVQGVSCSGADDAILSVSVPLGADSAQVFWVTGLDTLYGAVLSGMGPGTYSVFVPGCFVPDFVFVAEPPPISIFQIASTPPTCDEPCSGTATVQAIGGTAPYTYSWAHDPLESSDAASGLCEGVTAVGVVDDLGCANRLPSVSSDSNSDSRHFRCTSNL